MTTIAYRDGVLASDGRTSSGNVVLSDNEKKIMRLSDGALFALAGDVAYTGPMLEALEDDAELPKADGAFTAVIVETNGALRIYEGAGGFMAIVEPFAAFGSGAAVAYGAMEMGASAEEAVRIATRRDTYSGGAIQVECAGYRDPRED
jgi:ATP-dependent protease HslVU (ClpYQ) peptidase subunit